MQRQKIAVSGFFQRFYPIFADLKIEKIFLYQHIDIAGQVWYIEFTRDRKNLYAKTKHLNQTLNSFILKKGDITL